MPGESSLFGPSEEEIRLEAADLELKGVVTDSPEMRNVMSVIMADAVIASQEYELANGQEPDLRDPRVLLFLLGGEDEARKKYGNEIMDQLLGYKKGDK